VSDKDRTELSKTDPLDVEIPEYLIAELEVLPNAQNGQRKKQWSPENDAILLKYWGVKIQTDIASIIGLNVSTCRSRYRYLMKCKEEGREPKSYTE
jgi:hypothetical protein